MSYKWAKWYEMNFGIECSIWPNPLSFELQFESRVIWIDLHIKLIVWLMIDDWWDEYYEIYFVIKS